MTSVEEMKETDDKKKKEIWKKKEKVGGAREGGGRSQRSRWEEQWKSLQRWIEFYYFQISSLFNKLYLIVFNWERCCRCVNLKLARSAFNCFWGANFKCDGRWKPIFFKSFFFLRWNFLKCSHKCSNEENDYAPNATGEAQENGDFHWGGGARKGVGGAREEGGGVNKKKERNELEFFKKKPSWNSTSATSTAEASHKKKKT